MITWTPQLNFPMIREMCQAFFGSAVLLVPSKRMIGVYHLKIGIGYPTKVKLYKNWNYWTILYVIVWDDEKSGKKNVRIRPAPYRYGRTASLSLRGQRLERCENSVRLPRHSPDNGAETSCISTKSSPFVYFVGCRLKCVYIYIYMHSLN